jgi:hypothetical protein
MKLLTLPILVLLFCFRLSAQHSETPAHQNEDSHHAEHESLKRHKAAVTFGLTHIPDGFEEEGESGDVYVPTIGFDFFYFINHKWSLSFVADLELANYLVDFDREDLNREKAFILALQGGYEIVPAWAVLLGGGIEIETHKNLFVLRLGTEYDLPLNNGWSFNPSFFFDFKEEFSTWTLSIGLGKRF